MRVFRRRSTAALAGIVSVAYFCVISTTTTTSLRSSSFVQAAAANDAVAGQRINNIDNSGDNSNNLHLQEEDNMRYQDSDRARVRNQPAHLDQALPGSRVVVGGGGEEVQMAPFGVDSGLLGSAVVQPAAAAAAARREQGSEEDSQERGENEKEHEKATEINRGMPQQAASAAAKKNSAGLLVSRTEHHLRRHHGQGHGHGHGHHGKDSSNGRKQKGDQHHRGHHRHHKGHGGGKKHGHGHHGQHGKPRHQDHHHQHYHGKHGHGHHKHHRHHQKHPGHHGHDGGKKHRVHYPVTRELNLICEDRIIDKIQCHRRPESGSSASSASESFPVLQRLQSLFGSSSDHDENFDSNDNDRKDEMDSAAADRPLSALHTHSNRIEQRYIFMSSPCSESIPQPSCANDGIDIMVRDDIAVTNAGATRQSEDTDRVEEEQGDGGDDDDDDDDDSDVVEDDGGDDHDDFKASNVEGGQFEAEHNSGHHQHHHHHHSHNKKCGKHHHRNKNHHHRHHHHKEGHGHDHPHNPTNKHPSRHPYKDLCVAKGIICGSRLYGCHFQRTTLYECQAVGEPPLVRLVDAKACGGVNEDEGEGGSTTGGGGESTTGSGGGSNTSGGGSTSSGGGSTSSGGGSSSEGGGNIDACKCTRDMSITTTSICGSQLPTRCNIEPNAIYFCPRGPGSNFEVLQICQPGTQCRAGRNGGGSGSNSNPVCGASTCDCRGTNRLCADQFPDTCAISSGIIKNTAYQCTNDGSGKFEKVQECPSDQTCVSTSGGTICASNDCTCSKEGTVCGEIFPLKCRIPTMALYACIKGKRPVFLQKCDPGRCSRAFPPLSANALTVSEDDEQSSTTASLSEVVKVAGVVFEGLSNSNCIDSCICTSPGIASGSTFPKHCKLEASRLYICGDAGTTPTPGKKCVGPHGCVINAGDDGDGSSDGDGDGELTCPCKTVGAGIHAGADLPPECHADPTLIYFCPKDDGSGDPSKPPGILQQCPPGTLVQSRPRPQDPQCGFSSCNCTISTYGSIAVCSEQFPPSCNLTPNSVYKCSASGVPERVSTCPSSDACVSGIFDQAVCSTSKDGCKCAEDGHVCGSAFPLSCGLSSKMVFRCKKGQASVVETKCSSGTTCISTTPSAAQCFESCACAVKGDVCGTSFSPTCKFDAGTIYKCDGPGGTPTAGETCSKGCIVQAGADICRHDGDGCSCEAVGVGAVCGSDLPASCKAEANAIYVCRNAKQTAPEVLSACHPGTLCEKRSFPAGAACGATSCNCTIQSEICSDNIRETCDLNPNSIYKCSPNGATELVRECDSSTTCVTHNDTSACVSNNCICSQDGEVCGDAFPLSCKLRGSTIFSCVKGKEPVAKRDCDPARCSPAMPGKDAKCINPCSCDRNDIVCGSTFPSICSYNSNALYKCTGTGFKPIPTTLCGVGQCSVNAGPDTCNGPSAPIDPGPDRCTCPSTSSPVCGKVLALTYCNEVMDVDPNLIYFCPNGAGTLPEIQRICNPGTACIIQPDPIGATCGGTTCRCKGVAEICSSAFKDRCDIIPNSVYKCTESGLPRLVQTCTSEQVCVTKSNGSQCVSNDCRCDSDGLQCGERFHLSCALKGTAMYSCVKGERPVFIKDYVPDRCFAYVNRDSERVELESELANAAAAVGVQTSFANITALDATLEDIDDRIMSACLCTMEISMVCGQTFPVRCGLNRQGLYRCDGANKSPVEIEACPANDGCVVNPGDDDCDDCLCNGPGQECGRKFPESCAFDPDQLFSCPGGLGSEPIPKEKCEPNGCIEEPSGNCHCGAVDPCRCSESRHICGSTFPPECHLDSLDLYVCNREGSLPIKIGDCAFGCLKSYPAEADRCKTEAFEAEDCTCRDKASACGTTYPDVCEFDDAAVYTCTRGKGSSPRLAEKCKSGRCLVKEGADSVCDPVVITTTTTATESASSPTPTRPTTPAETTTAPTSEPTSISSSTDRPTSPTSEPTSSEEPSTTSAPEKSTSSAPSTSTASSEPSTSAGEHATSTGTPTNDPITTTGTPATTESASATSIPQPPTTAKATTETTTSIGTTPTAPTTAAESTLSGTTTTTVHYDPTTTTPVSPQSSTTTSESSAPPPTTSTVPRPTPECECKEKKEVCGSSFPGSCGRDGDTLYTCLQPGGTPALGDKCVQGCLVKEGLTVSDECKTPDCNCQKAGILCGDSMQPRCAFSEQSVYDCTGGVGSTPALKELCVPGSTCLENADGASCGGDKCTCTGDLSVCASQFPDSCGLKNNTLYKCTPSGRLVLDKTCAEGQQCLSVVSSASCASSDCKCTESGSVCGLKFPPSCKLNSTSLYTCETGESPVLSKDCSPGFCSVATQAPAGPSSDKCSEPCVCAAIDRVCGGTFVGECNLDAGSLYECTAIGSAPGFVEKCTDSSCSAKVGPDTCASAPEPPPQCFCNRTTTICGSSLDPKCDTVAGGPIDPNSIYTCSGDGQKPVKGTACTVDEVCTEESTTTKCKSLCTCTGSDPKCSKDFPDACHLTLGVYKCGADGKPETIANCSAGTICAGGAPEPLCIPPECACKNNNSRCGSSFDDKCGYEKNGLYSCKKDDHPVRAEGCGNGTCSASVLPPDPTHSLSDFCIQQCQCKEAGTTVCASTFDPICSLDSKALMSCSKLGEDPTLQVNCTLACEVKPNAPDVCKFDPCACSAAGDVCGSSFPATCTNETNTVYSCAVASALPVKNVTCADKEVCLKSPAGPVCTPEDCICKDDDTHCGSTFVDACKLEKNTLYKCVKGELPVVDHDCGLGTCSANVVAGLAVFRAAAVDTCLDQCACKEANVPVCSTVFDPSCNYGNKSLMDCGNSGDVPTVKEACTLSCTKQAGPDVCTFDPCTCTEAKETCGSTFPDSCNYEKDSQYTCSGNKALPTNKTACPTANVCLVTPTGPVCTPTECICKDDGSHCGSTFATSCNLPSNTLYKCTNGQLPKVVKDCGTGTCSANVVAGTSAFKAMTDDKCLDQCACKEANVPVCATAFDAACNYDNKTLMDCGNAGDVPTVKENCTLSCTKQPGPDVCTLDPCACNKAGDKCGSFPSTCGLEKDSVYSCSGDKALPQSKTACTESSKVCLETPSGPTCTPPDCICKDNGTHCGSTFTAACNLQSNILYQCTEGGLPSVLKDCGNGTCSANVVKGTAEFRAFADDKCLDQCACKEANVPVCASAFDALCNYKEKDLMNCKDAGDVPEVKETCTLSCTKQTGPDECAFDPCACSKASDTCGNTFPSTCPYEKNSTYSCAGSRELPIKKDACPTDKVCLVTPTGPVCTPQECICTDDGLHCGSTFATPCNLQINILYNCTNGQLPSIEKDCGTGICSANVVTGTSAFKAMADDKCLDLCACKEANVPVCASVFDTSCNYGNKSLMDCGNSGDVPTVKEACTLSCTKQAGHDVCTFDPCACTETKETCGSTFPDSCNYEKDSQYTCSGDKALPVKTNACPTNNVCLVTPTGSVCTPPECICKDDGSHCGSTFATSCNLQSNTLYKCTNGQLSTVDKDCGTGTCSANVVAGTSAFNAMADDTCLDQCACKEANVPVCSTTFDPVCGYGNMSVMDCGNAGDVPMVKENCTLSCTKQPGPDVCTLDPCACTQAGEKCGSSFPSNCSLIATSFYSCAANKTLPVKKSDCPAGNVCLETATALVCTLPECICKDTVNMCGSAFTKACGLQPNTLYKCVKGALPAVVKDCGTGTCSANVVKGTSVAVFSAMADDFCIDQCACKEAGVPICASAFPAICKYDPKALMTCDKVSSVPTVKEVCTKACTVQPGPDVCEFDPCACTKVGDVCGSTFPVSCNYKANIVYSCPAVKVIPARKTTCLNNAICFVQSTGPKCTPPECICKDNAAYCGSTFMGTCFLATNTLYTCVNGSMPTLTKDCLPGVCSRNIVSDFTSAANDLIDSVSVHRNVSGSVAESIDANIFAVPSAYRRISDFSATADEFCVGECACKEQGALVCSSSFPTTCKYDPSALMMCNEVGDVPVTMLLCSKGCVQTTAKSECEFDPCSCTSTGDTCGSSLPANCSYAANTVYTCAGPAALPEIKTNCTVDTTCSEAAAGPTCIPTACVCKDDGTHCGSQFPTSCNYTENTLYQCVTGLVPTVLKDCGDATCSANIKPSGAAEFMAAGVDTCVDNCACQKANEPVCAFSFPSTCNYVNKTLMSCGNLGDVPVVSKTCTAYCDVIKDAPDVCGFDPCACRRVGDSCGKSFPSNCGYLADSLYTCAINQTLPVKKADCKSSEICQMVSGGTDICVANKVCDCVGSGTVCTDRFPADCAKPANSMVTCPAGTVTACPDGCAAGECKAAGCLCQDNNVKCGSSFAPSCNLIPTALYTCVNGLYPVLKSDCGALACVRSTPNAMCQDPCKCRGTNAVCGSSFPTSCSLSSNTVFTCTAIGATPSPGPVCGAGCYASNPDASCKKECATAVTAATAQIDKVVAAIGALVPNNSVTGVVYPPLVTILNQVNSNLTTAKDDLTALATMAATSSKTVDSVLLLFKQAQVDLSPLTTSAALNTSLLDLPTLMQQVATCANSTTAECLGTIALYKSFADAAIAKATSLAVGTRAATLGPIAAQLKTLSADLEKTLTTGDTSTLRATGQTLGTLIGTTTGNVVKYGDISNSLLLMYDAFSVALQCKGVDPALFADKCAMYRDRLSGIMTDFIQFFQDNLSAIPIVGPMISDTLLASLKTTASDLQKGTATSAGDMVALIYGIQQVIDTVSPVGTPNVIRDYLNRLVRLLTVPTECLGGVSPCSGFLKIIRMMSDGLVESISAIPLAGAAIGVVLNPLMDGLNKALATGSKTAISASYKLLSDALSVVEVMPFFGNIAAPFRSFLELINKLVNCLV